MKVSSNSVIDSAGGLRPEFLGGKHLLRGILFDLDGTLVDSMPYFAEAWQVAFREHGLKVSAEEIYKREGEQSNVTIKELFLELCQRLPEQSEVDSVHARYRDVFAEIFELRFYPGALELIEQLKQRDLTVGLVTGSGNLQPRFSNRPGFLEQFKVLVTGNDTKRGKPAPDPYQLGLQGLGLKSEQCLVVENAKFGILSAQAAQIPCAVVIGSSPLSRQSFEELKPHAIFDSMEELSSKLLN